MVSRSTGAILSQIRALMVNLAVVKQPLQAYIVPSIDAHNSEYLADCDKLREFVSGFSGSVGTAIITNKQALLWTDGRYFLQASQQMDENWTLMKEGVPSVPTQSDWLVKNLPNGSKIGVDPKHYTFHMWASMQQQLDAAGHKLVPVEQNLVDLVWGDKKPSRPANPVLPLGTKYTGRTIEQKLKSIRDQMKEKRATWLVLTSLDEIAWTLNLRGSDIQYNPLFFSYAIINETSLFVFMNPQQVTNVIKEHITSEINGQHFEIRGYDDVKDFLQNEIEIKDNVHVWFSEDSNYFLMSLLPTKNIMMFITPVPLMKAVKNDVELNGMRNAHLKDGAALCCYFAWLEKNVAKEKITEVSGATKLEQFRAMQADFVGPSFATISSVGPHGAIIHYQPDNESDVQITTNELYLCDSGGQYKDGTTDVTRTLHFGTPTQFEREAFTRVLKGQITLATSIFPSKIKGNCLDSFARQYLWNVGLDYAHGTGHGIGSYLGVHEGPMGISWRPMVDDPGLEAGMLLSNEPGYYEDGKFGIRLEDIVQIVPANTTHNFQNRGFLTFETITFCPKQTKMMVVEMLTPAEIKYINDYHKQCRELLGPILKKQQQNEAYDWLMKETEPIGA